MFHSLVRGGGANSVICSPNVSTKRCIQNIKPPQNTIKNPKHLKVKRSEKTNLGAISILGKNLVFSLIKHLILLLYFFFNIDLSYFLLFFINACALIFMLFLHFPTNVLCHVGTERVFKSFYL